MLASAAQADETSVRASIQGAYDRACTAMHYKYLDGVLGVRARGYQAYNSQGGVDPTAEIRSLASTLSSATSVSETTTILELQQVNDHTVRVRVKDVLELGRGRSGGQTPPPVIVRSNSDDTWVLEDRVWRLQTVQVRSQDVDRQ